MSTGMECYYIEINPNEWYYVLEGWDSPKGAWDWREYAEAAGPFPTFDAAYKHLHDHNANPGGYCKQSFEPGYKPDEVERNLIANAEKPRTESRFTPRRYW